MSPQPVLGVVGVLQFDVLNFRLKEEYNSPCRFEPFSIYAACWINGSQVLIDKFRAEHLYDMAKDKYGNLLYLCPNEIRLAKIKENNQELEFDLIRK